jgi:murein DD-endopeptidase MepM/ murein hydrolase activator NlpD
MHFSEGFPMFCHKSTLSAVLLLGTLLTGILSSTHSRAYAGGLKFAPAGGVITSEFGYRIDPFNKKRRFHSGLDIAGPVGTPIYAPEPGTVAYAAEYAGYGQMVLVKHDRSNLFTVYGHCSKILVTVGQRVAPGQMVAQMGSTGRSTGSHLHFEVHHNNQYMNPVDYLMFLQNEQVASGLIQEKDLNEADKMAPTPMPPAIGGPDTPVDLRKMIDLPQQAD